MRMNWMRGGQFGNMGDLFGPIIVAAHTGEPVEYAPTTSLRQRLITVGTIGQKQRFGRVDIWGAGFGGRSSGFRVPDGFQHPAFTRFMPHALRGPFSAALLRRSGYAVPDVYGDPAWLLPRLWPASHIAKRWELGVVIHLSEVESKDPAARARAEFLRYSIPEEMRGSVILLNTVVERGIGQVRARVEDILACRRVLSTSLHALAVAEAYGIPCAAFDFHAGPSGRFAVDDDAVPIDHRMRDFYAGSGRDEVLVYRNERHLPTDWEAAMGFMDRHWEPLTYDPSRLLEAFPRHLGQMEALPRPEAVARLPSLIHLGRH
ncbi:polysaccharide pyruvyl transferase family protein [Roseomonas marmotae]|uniref:Polysaccharide pyruvyl transferase family protein n=1 Tax=Roseomonas marmotae TaxID=2768161 RepID=A0ABS3KCX9_9PROT|nr:polysaccharide pyruvyl transferase family protein [Roseomonas marmotae]MBO1075326.1 polysaccharide pyruvyl transferase family protein [Roseomonas marmotae]QTI78303.1 polysaccharide pyruvyl transferase family protein [Roseomonas marmotae]